MMRIKNLLYELLVSVKEESESETKLDILTEWLASKVQEGEKLYPSDIENMLNIIGYEVVYENSEQD